MFDILEDSMGFINGRETDYSDVGSMLLTIANFFIIIAFGVSLVTFTYAIIQFITSTGDPKQIEKPRRALVWSFAGMIAALIVFGLRNLMMTLLRMGSEPYF